jgi:aspartokinase
MIEADETRQVVVVSAMQGVTDALIAWPMPRRRGLARRGVLAHAVTGYGPARCATETHA